MLKRFLLLGFFGLALPLSFWIAISNPFWSGTPTPILRPLAVRPNMTTLVEMKFDTLSKLDGWEEKIFKGRTLYQVELDTDGEGMLAATSSRASSALYRKVDVPIAYNPVLTWRWKSPVFPTNKKTMNLAAKEDNDFAGRVYVVFKSRSIFSADFIEYIWDDRFMEGSFAVSPYSDHIKMLVVQSGPPASDGWIVERRNVVRDYQAFFGKPPSQDIAAIAVMSDSDSTESQSGILIKNITLETAEKQGGSS